jgi:serine protease Do
VLTVFSSVLDADEINVTLADGRRLEATLVGADPGADVAVLKIEADELPFFDLDEKSKLTPGARVLALSNLFGVAVGNEPVSAQRGIVSAVTRLTAGLGSFESPYRGLTYVLDASTNNPGAAGGALLDREGRLAGMLGKELQNKLNRTWLNHAIPTAELKKPVERILSGRFAAEPQPERKKASRPISLAALGVTLVPDVLYRTPPYIDAVRPGSATAKAGLRADDIVVLVNDRLVQSCKQLEEELSYIPAGSVLNLTVIRGNELLEFGVK